MRQMLLALGPWNSSKKTDLADYRVSDSDFLSDFDPQVLDRYQGSVPEKTELGDVRLGKLFRLRRERLLGVRLYICLIGDMASVASRFFRSLADACAAFCLSAWPLSVWGGCGIFVVVSIACMSQESVPVFATDSIEKK